MRMKSDSTKGNGSCCSSAVVSADLATAGIPGGPPTGGLAAAVVVSNRPSSAKRNHGVHGKVLQF